MQCQCVLALEDQLDGKPSVPIPQVGAKRHSDHAQEV